MQLTIANSNTALCENALHYDNKTTINKQILCRFQKIFFSKIKKLKHTFYRQMFCALSDRSLGWNTPVFSRFTSREHANLIGCHFFHTHELPHRSKAQLLGYYGKRSFLGVAKGWKVTLDRVPWFGRHVENLGDVSYIKFWLLPGLIIRTGSSVIEHMAAWLIRNFSSRAEGKFRISPRPCNIRYLFFAVLLAVAVVVGFVVLPW